MNHFHTVTTDQHSRYATSQPSMAGENRKADYSEEAIPERDPSYRASDGTWDEGATVEAIPAEMRLALANSLEQLGMSAARARLLAAL